MDIKIIVASHKPCRLPEDDVYLPVQCGAAFHEPIDGFLSDCAGDNMGEKNPFYCELTAMYAVWKNLPADYVGLCHYRRFFTRKQGGDKWAKIAGRADYEAALAKADILLPRPRNYFIETNYSQYVHAHPAIALDTTLDILKEQYPAYVPAWDKVMERTWGHRFNMFVMRRDLFEKYCGFLFSVLGELEQRLDISSFSAYDKRVYGFVGERLMDVWLETEQLKYTELPVAFMEKQNWFKKGGNFLLRKLRGGRKE